MPSTADDPLITVIIPVYNVAKLIERCVNSVLNQTYENLEIILVDDGSTDMGGKFCDVFAKRDPRVKVIHQSNRGLSAARNAALAIATGEYVTFVDSDDSVDLELVETLYNLCSKYKTRLSICGFKEVKFGQTTPASSEDTNESDAIQLLPTYNALEAMLCERGFSMSAWGKLYARSLFKTVRFPEGKLYEDVGTTYRLMLQCDEVVITAYQGYNYYTNNTGSITKQSFSPQKLDLIELTDRMCDELETWSKRQPSSTQLQITNLTKKRRMHARFSILRQIVMLEELSDENKLIQKDIVKYLKSHKSDILHNPLTDKRDKLAMYTLLLGVKPFKLAWESYVKQRM